VAALAAEAPETVVLRNRAAQVAVAPGGGAIVEFRLLESGVNPLAWELGPDLEARSAGRPFLRGHFLCLDRWGAPSEAEVRNGMPFHGEAPRTIWRAGPRDEQSGAAATLSCDLPMAGLGVAREVRLAPAGAALTVVERVTNRNKLGRIYNMVQHPTIAPPFLAESTVIDTNARLGFAQAGPIPKSPAEAAAWPSLALQGQPVDLRHLRSPGGDLSTSDVTSFVFDESVDLGWVTASSPESNLLLGYCWRTRDYPWLNLWRQVLKGRASARGLEFGTTGYHQPFTVLVRTGRLLDRPLYDFLDANETVRRSYAAFLARIPGDFRGVARVGFEPGRIVVVEQGASPRSFVVDAGSLSLD
jgi:hypothetical protein